MKKPKHFLLLSLMILALPLASCGLARADSHLDAFRAVTPTNFDAGGAISRQFHLNAESYRTTATIARTGPARELASGPDDDVAMLGVRHRDGRSRFEEYVERDPLLDAVVVVHDGRIVFEFYNRMEPWQRHFAWSVSKVVAAAAVGALAHAGKVSVDEPVESYVGELADTAWAGIRVRDIANMASGMDCLDDDGYQDAETPDERQVYAMADGPGTYSKWLTWAEFGEWVQRMEQWNECRLGRFCGRVDPKPPAEIAERVLRDLVSWSTETPKSITNRWPKAKYGLAGIEHYAATLEASDPNVDEVACHPINGQWTVRNSTSVYLKRVAEDCLFAAPVNAHLLAAAGEYRAAYDSWQQLYTQYLGHGVPGEKRKTREHRLGGAAAVRKGLAHEKAALAEVERALAEMA